MVCFRNILVNLPPKVMMMMIMIIIMMMMMMMMMIIIIIIIIIINFCVVFLFGKNSLFVCKFLLFQM